MQNQEWRGPAVQRSCDSSVLNSEFCILRSELVVMRWLAYFIFAYLVLALQIGLAPYLAYQGAAPNFVLLAVVFIAINAPRDAAPLGCFSPGVLQDPLSP